MASMGTQGAAKRSACRLNIYGRLAALRYGATSEQIRVIDRMSALPSRNDHERGFLAFLAEPSRRRIGALLELGEKRRGDVRELLDHSVSLDPLFCQHLVGRESFPASVEAALRERGAPATCYILTASTDLDGREIPLREALDAVTGGGNGAFVSCIPGRLGFYRYEDANSSYLLSR